MQDKRVTPGTTDYYVHDEDGRPLFRADVPSHDSLTEWLGPIVTTLRQGLGAKTRFVVAFDRAGAFPEALASLRDGKFDCVTYERKPYALWPEAGFDKELTDDGETIRYGEKRTNLGRGRGRVRRIAIRTADGKQINLLATGDLPATELIVAMRGRWVQENGFKHGVERWGINQLDGRQTVPYSPETVVPNPARRRLDRAIRVTRAREGELRCALAKLAPGKPRRSEIQALLTELIAERDHLIGLRPSTPARAPLGETELQGELVRHTSEYKMTIDTIRIACANVESDLAAELAKHLPRAAEAKRTLRNLLAAPGDVQVRSDRIDVHLHPAGTAREQAAFAALLRSVNERRLQLPGDPGGRPLHFHSQP